ncbi:S-layer homology domain-containing protein [Paenibacillus doosanensis]|uniref:S-layer homology domain-containing protein n=1 Tax=Paenibacillus doosanensis TaxID=1229154 RepID=UPI0021802B03|nr:S-layer homology domain-containing protein [Paenibacillus doosanensis]MCS7459967.1 S-layer homology domain-containing protein [Paenibacillus doosanensis]
MRESSSNLFKQNSQQPKDIRGGEKKVMKKSLSTILSLAMAFSMFSSVAFGEEAEAAKTSADFSDLKDLDAATKAKFDAMISAGIFDGVSEGTFGLKDQMNRAQFAKVAALVFKLKVDTSLKTSSFNDVKADDPANGYALPYIEAVKAAGITDGYAEGEYNPAGEVTKEQLAAFLLRGLKLDSDAKATPGVSDSTVSDWAKGYVALALEKKLLTNNSDGTFGGTTAATRDLLVLGSYEAKQQYKPDFNGKYAIASLKATDAKELTLELNGALSADDAKNLKIEVKKDGNVLSSGYTTKWNDDRTTATLTFDTKFVENTFDVTISGLSNIDDTAKTSSVTTTKEKVTKIDFLTASDTLPLAVDKNGDPLYSGYKVRIDFKATNQYGKQASFIASNFDIRVSDRDASITSIAGAQAFNLTEGSKTERNDRLSITILHEDSGVQVNKIFTIGDEPIVSKIEVGDLLNSSGNKVDAVESNSYAFLDLKAWDQYGLRVENKGLLNDSVTVSTTDRDLEIGDDDKDAFVDDAVGDTAADLKLRSTNNEEKTVNVNIFARGGQSVSKDIKIKASKVPATVEFGSYNYTLAEGDVHTQDESVDNKFYVPLVLKDSNGDLLDADDIVDAYGDGRDKLDIRSSGGINLASSEIATSGTHKGQIEIQDVDRKGSASITVTLRDFPNQKATMNISVGDVREAQEIKFSTAPKKQMVAGSNGAVTDNELKFKIYDQQGAEMKYISKDSKYVDNGYFVKLIYSGPSGDTNTYLASKQKATDGSNAAYGNRKDVFLASSSEATYTSKIYDLKTAQELLGANDWDNFFDKSFKVYSKEGAAEGSFTVKAELYSYDIKFKDSSDKYLDANAKLVDSVSQTIEVIDPKKAQNKLTYEAYLDKGVNNTILAGDDYLNLNTVVDAAYMRANYPKLGKEIKIRAKNSGGEEVKLPTNIVSVSSSNPSVANIADKKFVYGLDAGTAKLNVIFVNAKNEQQTAQIELTTKNEGPSVATISLKKTGKTATGAASLVNKFLWDKDLAEKITVKDQYGDEIVSEGAPGSLNEENGASDQYLQGHVGILGLSFYVSDVVASGTGTATVDSKTGQITKVDGDVSSFTINVLAPSGVTASFAVTVGSAN